MINSKLEILKQNIRDLGKVAVAFSGGVDSTFLLRVSHDVLEENVIAISSYSGLFPKREGDFCKEFCMKEGTRHIALKYDAMSNPAFISNPKDRCYVCKTNLMSTMKAKALELGCDVLIEGSNADDIQDYRPGMKALGELGIISPLKEAGFTKSEIRTLSKEMGLPTWDMPSFACLATRFVYGESITEEKLRMVEDAEQFLYDQGFHQFRVRIHESGVGEAVSFLARVEVAEEDLPKLFEKRVEIHSELCKLGFSFVTMDMKGYRTGSMNVNI